MSEQRLFLRKKVPLPIPIELLPGKEMWLHDLGEGGLSVSGSSRIEPGTATLFSFQFPDAASIIEASGVVAWCDGSGRVGIRFTRIKPDSSAVLKRWLKTDEKQPLSGTDQTLPEPYRACIECDAAILREEIARTSLDSERALELLAERMKDRTRASGAAIALRENDSVLCRASSGNAPPSGTTLTIDRTATGECYRSGNIVSITDTENDPRVDAELCRQLEFRSLLIVPVTAGDAVVGIVEVFSPLPGNFEGGDTLLLGSIAEVAAEIYGAQDRKTDASASHTLEVIPIVGSGRVGELVQSVTPVEGKEVGAGAVSDSIAQRVEQSAGEHEPTHTIAPSTSPKFEASSADDQREREDANRWKPRHYLLLMAGLTVLGIGMGDLVDWYLTSRLARSRTHPAPLVAVMEQKLVDDNSASPLPSSSNTQVPSAPLHPGKVGIGKNKTIALKTVASPGPEFSSNIAALAPSDAVQLAGPAPNLDLKTTAQLTPAKLLHRVEPVVPDFAKSSGMAGTVLLSAIIGTDGRLKDVKFVSGDRALAIEAFRAVRDWRYRPYMLNGKPIEAETRIMMNFRP